MANRGVGLVGAPSGSRSSRTEPIPASVEFTEVDEARTAFLRLIAPVSFQVVESSSLIWRLTAQTLGPFTLLTDVVPGGLRLATVDAADRYILALPLAGAMSVRHGGADGTTRPGRTGAMFSLMQPGRCDIAPGSAQHGLVVEREALDDHVKTLTGAHPRRPLLFHPLFDLEQAAGARLEQLLLFAAMELQRPGGVDASPLFARHLTETLLSAILELIPHDHAALLTRAAPAVAPACVRLAEAYIDAHAAEPLTVPDVARAVGVSVRALQAAFRRFRDRSPLDHLKARRLQHARARLLAPTPGLTVTRVAHDAGYRHVGYFIRAYERQFGERPGHTLARLVGSSW